MKNSILIIIFILILITGAISFYLYIYTNQPPKGDTCQNLCGDGVCQEVVCMAIGCPCPETSETCPQDCKSEISNLNSKSCQELEELKTKEFNRLDFNCKTDTNCNLIPIACGLCVNKNTDTEKYEEIYSVMAKKACIPIPGCLRAEYKCLCLNNKCELKVIPLGTWNEDNWQKSGQISLGYKEDTNPNIKILDQMLSTFKFLE